MKDIKFIAPKIYIDNFNERPIPSLNHLPDWYKKLKHHPNKTTIKGCRPFMDSMSTGYILTTPQEYYIDITTLEEGKLQICLLYTSPSPRDVEESRMPSSA